MELAQKEAHLILISRNQRSLEKLADEIITQNPRSDPEIFPADVSLLKEVKNIFTKITRSKRKLDGLIHNVGSSYPGYFEKMPIQIFEDSVRINYMSSVYCARTAYPHLNEGGFISFTSSVVGFMGVFGYSSYAGPKFALLGLAETLSQELAHRKIRVSVLCPPDTETPGFKNENKTKPIETKKLSEGAKLMKPQEVAKKFVKKLAKGKFLITCNFESALFFRLHSIFPNLTRKIMTLMIRSYQKKK